MNKNKQTIDVTENTAITEAVDRARSNKNNKYRQTNEKVHICVETKNDKGIITKPTYTLTNNKNIEQESSKDEGKSDIVLDSCATVSIYANKKLVKNIRKTNNSIIIQGVTGHELIIDKEATSILTNSTVYYDERASTNIESLYIMSMSTKEIRFNSKENEFQVDTYNGNTIIFTATYSDKLFKYKIIIPTKEINKIYTTTVEENIIKYTKREINRAKEARNLQDKMALAESTYKKMITAGTIHGADVTIKDIENARNIFGESTSSLKGRMTNKKIKEIPITKIPTYIDKNTILYIDIMFVNGYPYLISVSNNCGLIILTVLVNRSTEHIGAGIKEHVSTYKGKRFEVIEIHSDDEGGVKASKHIIENMGITLQLYGKGTHVNVVERKIRQVKEHARTKFSMLPYNLTLDLQSMYSVYIINSIPQFSKGVYLSPRELFTGERLEINKLKLSYGDYVQYNNHHNITNTLKQRAEDGIALYPTGDRIASWYILNLDTWKLVKRADYVLIPIPKSVINRINEKSYREDRIKIKQLNDLSTKETVLPDDHNDDDNENNEGKNENQYIPIKTYNETNNETNLVNENNEDDNDINNMDGIYDNNNNDDIILEGYEPMEDIKPTHHEDELEIKYWTSNPTTKDNISTHRYNLRSYDKIYATTTTNLSIKQSIELGPTHIDAIIKELQQLFDFEVWRPLKEYEIKDKSKAIPSKIFVKEKRDGKVKARLVAGGHKQNKNLYEINETSSPTVSTMALFLVICSLTSKSPMRSDNINNKSINNKNINNKEINQFKFTTIDIAGAYLHCPMEETNKPIDMYFDSKISAILCIMRPELKNI
jgi:hypothetical protein